VNRSVEKKFSQDAFCFKGGRREPDLIQSDFSLLERLSCRHKVSFLRQSKRGMRCWRKGEKERESGPGNEAATC